MISLWKRRWFNNSLESQNLDIIFVFILRISCIAIRYVFATPLQISVATTVGNVAIWLASWLCVNRRKFHVVRLFCDIRVTRISKCGKLLSVLFSPRVRVTLGVWTRPPSSQIMMMIMLLKTKVLPGTVMVFSLIKKKVNGVCWANYGSLRVQRAIGKEGFGQCLNCRGDAGDASP